MNGDYDRGLLYSKYLLIVDKAALEDSSCGICRAKLYCMVVGIQSVTGSEGMQ
jgi:hypothetical protein